MADNSQKYRRLLAKFTNFRDECSAIFEKNRQIFDSEISKRDRIIHNQNKLINQFAWDNRDTVILNGSNINTGPTHNDDARVVSYRLPNTNQLVWDDTVKTHNNNINTEPAIGDEPRIDSHRLPTACLNLDYQYNNFLVSFYYGDALCAEVRGLTEAASVLNTLTKIITYDEFMVLAENFDRETGISWAVHK